MSQAQGILENAKGLFQRGERGAALSVLGAMETVPVDAPDPLMLGAYASLQLGDAALAERLLGRVVEAYPQLPAAHHNLSKMLLAQDRAVEAADACTRAARLAPDDAGVHTTLGLALERMGRPDRAEEPFRHAVALAPDDPAMHDNLGRALGKQTKDTEALQAHGKALELEPRHAASHFNIGQILFKRELFDRAERSFREALASDPKMAAARNNLGLTLQRLGRLDEAADEMARAAEASGDPAPYFNIAGLRLEQGDPQAAIAACDAALAREPANNTAMALKAIALCEAGDADGARYYNDVDRFLKRVEVAGYEAHGSLDAFNQELFHQVSATPDRITEPGTDQARQTRDIFREPSGALATFRDIIDRAVADYAAGLGESDHPFVAARPARWDLTAWGTIVRITPDDEPTHIHAHAWLSGVYYPRVPDEVGDGTTSQAGCIEFGRPPQGIRTTVEPPLTVIRPREGLLLLFPSYFYHRILPFRTPRTRMSLAFDAVPA